MMTRTLSLLLCTLFLVCTVGVCLGAEAGSKASAKYEWPIAGSVQRVHLASTQKDFLSNPRAKQPYWYTQRVDHFSTTDMRTFHQRFFVYEPAHVDPHGPIIMYVAGQKAMNEGIPEDDVRLIAKHWAAPVVMLEHRYYGESQPMKDLKTSSLEFLTTRQALADLANFRDFFQNVYNKLHGFPAHNSHPWLTVGTGYGGALAAWFRLKYPHLAKGAIASSATVNAMVDFYEFDLATAKITGKECGGALRDAVNGITALLSSDLDRAHIDEVFASTGLAEEDFMTLLRDAVTLPVAYGRMHEMCSAVVSASRAGESVVHALAEHLKKNFAPIFAPNGYNEYALHTLQDTRLSKNGTARQAFYQQCTELGQFKTSAKNGKGVIPHALDTAFYHRRCHKVFGEKLWPDVDQTNRIYGRDMISASHIFFVNGGQDPYRLASVSHMVRPSEPAMVVKCYNCAHAVDLRGCPSEPNAKKPGVCQDQQAILNARKATMHFINIFLRTP